MIERIVDEKVFKIPTILEEYTRKCLAIAVSRHISSQDIIFQVFQLFIFRSLKFANHHIRLFTAVSNLLTKSLLVVILRVITKGELDIIEES